MELYYSPGACSLASHIALNEVGVKYTAVEVNLETHDFAGGDFRNINPKGYVPALKLNDGQVLSESAVVLQYIADLKPDKNLIPKMGDFERYRAEEWLNFIATELHKNFAPFFSGATDETKEKAKKILLTKFALAAQTLAHSTFLMGEQCTVADFYLFVMTLWASKVGLDLPAEIVRFRERVNARELVQKTLEEELPH